MLSEYEAPEEVRNGPNGLYGDIDLFIRAYEAGEMALGWDTLVASNAICDDEKVRAFVQSSNHLSLFASTSP